MARNPNSVYCGNHIQEAMKKAQKEGVSTESIHFEDERIPCPLDGSHTVFKKSLESHLKICNATKQQQQLASLPYFKENCNGGNIRSTEEIDDCTVDMEELLKKIDKAYECIQSFIPTTPNHIPCSPIFDEVHTKIRQTIGKDQSSFKQVRHTEQDMALVDQLMSFNLLSTNHNEDDVNRIILEFGAGKGLLGLSAYLADPSISLYLVERSSNRKKIDRFFNITCTEEKGIDVERKQSNENNDSINIDDIGKKREKIDAFDRIRMDIRNCFLPKLSKIDKMLSTTSSDDNDSTKNSQQGQVTIIAKHLCGVASDLAIRSLANIPILADRKRCMRGLGLATCCHHCCTYEDYTGHEFLASHDITNRKEFELLKHWSGWATLERMVTKNDNNNTDSAVMQNTTTSDETTTSSSNTNNPSEHTAPPMSEQYRPSSLDALTMKEYGKKVKRILDYGRLHYVQKELQVTTISMVQYCSEELSPECIMLLAKD